MSYRGDERFELKGNFAVIRRALVFAEIAHAQGVSLMEQATARGMGVTRAALSPTTLGQLVASRAVIWGVTLNERLDERDAMTVLAHEIGHSWIEVTGGVAHCQPRRGGRDTVEEMSNAIGTLHAVPHRVIATLDLADDARASAIARRLDIATTYVYIRNALAIIMGEKSGSRGDAYSVLELGLLAHDGWVHDVSKRLQGAVPQPTLYVK